MGSSKIPSTDQEGGEIKRSPLALPVPGQPAVAHCGWHWVHLGDRAESLSSKFSKLTACRTNLQRQCKETQLN